MATEVSANKLLEIIGEQQVRRLMLEEELSRVRQIADSATDELHNYKLDHPDDDIVEDGEHSSEVD